MDPCNVCGGTDVNLVDGFYYCVECGTQDVNVRETVVEQAIMGDGTFAHTTSKRFTVAVKDGIEMSSEWHKWHCFNFILVGLTDELIALGAKPSVKMKVLWIWTRYVKEFQVKDDLQSSHILDIKEDSELENDKENSNDDKSEDESRSHKSRKFKSERIGREMKNITKGIILTILYVALNLDRSDIQLSHLFRFIREGRLSLYDCMKYVPKELKMNAVKNWKSFTLSLIEYNPISIRELSITCFRILKLGVPLVPDLRKIVGNFVKELCLPSDIKDLVFSLMHFMPIDFLHIDASNQKCLVRIPDYEGICMAYILVALKISFGLDDDYEVRISKEIDKINNEENYLKSYKLGFLSEPCDRLFSFNEWCQYLQFRKQILCKNYLAMSRQFNKETDDYTFMEHLEKKRKREVKLSDDVTMDILNKIKTDEEPEIIPKGDFPVTLTPMSTYIDILAQHIQDPDTKLCLCEDFTQYSLTYALKKFMIPSNFPDLQISLVGVSESEKIFNKNVVGTLTVQEGDMTMVYVRNCQNKNWLKTEPPKVDHVTKVSINEHNSDKDSDHGYDSHTENSNPESDTTHVTVTDQSVSTDDKLLEIIDDPRVNTSIFDDNFIDIQAERSNHDHITIKEENVDHFFEIDTQSNLNDTKIGSLDNLDDRYEADVTLQFDPNIFDRDKMIKDLISLACEKYKISIPKENSVKRQNKRKVNLADDTGSSSELKKKRTNNQSKLGEAKREVDNFITTYYNRLHDNILHEVSEQVKSIMQDVDNTKTNILDDQNKVNESCVMYIQNDKNDADISHLHEREDEKSNIENNSIDSVTGDNQAAIDSGENPRDNATTEENVEDVFSDEIFLQSDPKFDENKHDIRQLYVKLGENSDDISFLDVRNDPEIDKIINKQLEQCNNNDKRTQNDKKSVVTDEFDNFSDSDDDIPLSTVKEINCFKHETERRKKEELELLINDNFNMNGFKYWVRHYKSKYFVKSRDIGKKFDLELNENLPVSFVFVIRECAAILGHSMFSLYNNMQNIEEILMAWA